MEKETSKDKKGFLKKLTEKFRNRKQAKRDEKKKEVSNDIYSLY